VPEIPDYGQLQAELAAERQRRAALEARLAELEASLASLRGGPKKTADDLAAFSLHHALAAKADDGEERAALESWLLESELRIEDRERAERITTAPLPLLVEQTPRALSDKLAATSLAMEAAEQRAQHNAQQVKRLTEELMAARAEQIRTASRLRDLEERLSRTEHHAAYAPPVADWPRPDHSLPLPLEDVGASPEQMTPSSVEEDLMRVSFQMRAPADKPRTEQKPELRSDRKLPVFEEFELPGAPRPAHEAAASPTALSPMLAPSPETPPEAPATATAGTMVTPALNLEDALALWSTNGELPVTTAATETPTPETTAGPAENTRPEPPGLSLEEALAEFSASANVPPRTPTPAPEDTAAWQPLIDEAPDQEDSYITPSIAGLPGAWEDATAPSPPAASSNVAAQPPLHETIEPMETPAPVHIAADMTPSEPDTPDLKSGEVFEIEVIDEHTPLPPAEEAAEESETDTTGGTAIGIEDLEAVPLSASPTREETLASEAAPKVPASDLLEPVPDFEAEPGLVEENTPEPAETGALMADANPAQSGQEAYLEPLPEFVSEIAPAVTSRPPVSLVDLDDAEQERKIHAANEAQARPATRRETPITASARDGAGVMAESLRAWGGMKQPSLPTHKAPPAAAPPPSAASEAEDSAPADSPASSKGRKGMVEALMRFMGPR
jgi:hypothetical protein